MTGDTLVLDFMFTEEQASREELASQIDPALGLNADDDRPRDISTFVAKGSARLTSRTWQTPDREGRPRLGRQGVGEPPDDVCCPDRRPGDRSDAAGAWTVRPGR